MKKTFTALFMLFVLFTCTQLYSSADETGNRENVESSAAPDAEQGTVSEDPMDLFGDDMMSEFEVSPDMQRMMGIKTAAVEVRPVKKSIRTVGRVEYDETKLTTVNLKVEGWVEKLYADYNGKFVEKGAPLAEIYSPEWYAVQLEYLNLLKWRPSLGIRSQRNMEFSLGDRTNIVGKLTLYDIDPLVDVIKQKFDIWEIPENLITKIEKGNKPVRNLMIRSPATGYVFEKSVFKGTRVAPGDKMFDIVDLSTVWVLADIYEYEIPFVKAGDSAKITLSSYPRREFSADVDYVYPSMSGTTRTAKVRFVIPNPDMLLKPQMFADVEMNIDLGERLTVPETSILDTGERTIVYVDVGDGYFTAREVKVGDRAGGLAEILSGLDKGERVASSSVFLIDSEAKLRGVQ